MANEKEGKMYRMIIYFNLLIYFLLQNYITEMFTKNAVTLPKGQLKFLVTLSFLAILCFDFILGSKFYFLCFGYGNLIIMSLKQRK